MEIFEFFSFSCSLKPTETRNKSQEDDVYFIDWGILLSIKSSSWKDKIENKKWSSHSLLSLIWYGKYLNFSVDKCCLNTWLSAK